MHRKVDGKKEGYVRSEYRFRSAHYVQSCHFSFHSLVRPWICDTSVDKNVSFSPEKTEQYAVFG